MPLKFDVKYERSKKKIAKKIALTLIEETVIKGSDPI